ncbi:hypothetical protein EMIHUDRAFT_456566 [Emiliania huxleyi CCMP1516]|uniref:Methyltransferase domain-containing protein n=2 Tax=Emiliania huxleyi TaxID=2903 RepID=A0A0D3K404_EMIH1|nr:hypothetical protein EMIHUDRAFT_456566 [Emiliania huxleyi CCMP1516]EOD30489.1 hypothetical protein EMIHUDRAFT_456566 [Emiliania huxleyi CCMP1516]|eukprot:XP_005782918.1 hypothetical protein EMIHUDRAFT_456566 [Emiliania huxleyi CCMP1516]
MSLALQGSSRRAVEAMVGGSLAVAAGALVLRAKRAARCLSAATAAVEPPPESLTGYRAAVFSLRPSSFGHPAGEADARAMADARLVIVGEIHSIPPCVELQCRAALAMLASLEAGGRLHVVLEHLNFEQQPLLDAYAAGTLEMAALLEQYSLGTEGHDLAPYEPLLRLGRDHGALQLHAGFIPRSYAKIVMRESKEAAIEAARAQGYLAKGETLDGTEEHYSFFESLLTHRPLHAQPPLPPTDKFRRMFPAQLIKDAAMAHKVSRLLAPQGEGGADKALVVCGVGHSGYSHGVPERIERALPWLAGRSFRVWCLQAHESADLRGAEPVRELLTDAFGESAFAADASLVMRRLGYTPEQVACAGADAPNFQGVASPHTFAALQPGEAVVDLGSGLGVDSFIAAAAVGEAGRVTGVDIAASEVRHATARARERSLDGRVSFVVGDLERLPLPAASADAVISNGAFCLAPNKPKAFAEVWRVLRPGGRFAIATSVVLRPLEEGKWPLCMRMFSELSSLQPIATKAGFARVAIDTSDMAMAFELEAPEGEAPESWASSASKQRNQVHVGSAEFSHLQELDMNSICGRVVISGVKP